MKRRDIAFAAGALAYALSTSALAQSSADWVEVRGEKELRALYSNKTHRGRDYVGHYRDDGKSLYVSNETRTPISQTWATKGDDQVCITTSAGVSCYRFQRNRKKPDDIMATFVAQPVIFFFKVEDGIPKF